MSSDPSAQKDKDNMKGNDDSDAALNLENILLRLNEFSATEKIVIEAANILKEERMNGKKGFKLNDKLAAIGIASSILMSLFNLVIARHDRAYDILKANPKVSINSVDQNDDNFYGIEFSNAGQGLAVIDRVILISAKKNIQPPSETGWMKTLANLGVEGIGDLNFTTFSTGALISAGDKIRVVGKRRADITNVDRSEIGKIIKGIRFIVCYSSINGDKFISYSPGFEAAPFDLCSLPYSDGGR